jgi:hypothetical protein
MNNSYFKKIYLIFFLIFCYNFQSNAQKQAYRWYFGEDGAGLNFNSECKVSVLNDGNFKGFEGVSAISNKTTGELLFYTNSEFVMNKNHDTIPNSNLITNGATITQVQIIEKPGSSSIYYIFTSEVQGFSGQFYRYHAIDMTMNGGLGGILFKDSMLYNSPTTEKLTAIKHSNGIDLWIVGHEYNSNNYLAFKVTSQGVDTNPVISSIGKIHGDPSYASAIGELKASPNGLKLAAVTLAIPDIELFDFNKSTGQLSNLITIPALAGYDGLNNPISNLYGLSFSKNSKMLYATQWKSSDSASKIMQFNVSSNDSVQINNSKINIFTSQDKNLYSLKLAPDERIYVAQNQTKNFLGIINYPDSAGLSCNYVDSAISLGVSHSGWGLNNLMEYDDYCKEEIEEPNSIQSINESHTIQLSPNPFSVYATMKFNYEPSKHYQLNIQNIMGEKIKYPLAISGSQVKIERRNLPAGIYLYQLLSDGNVIHTGKFSVND